MLVYTLRTVNYQSSRRTEARQLVSKMSNVQKQRILDKIQLQQGIHGLLGQQYDSNMSQYIENLLKGGTK